MRRPRLSLRRTEPPPSPPAAGTAPASDPHNRIDALRSWIGDLERSLALRTYAGLALLVLALAAAGAAIALALSAEDDPATQRDLDRVRAQVAQIEDAASQQAEESVQSLARDVERLRDEVSALAKDQRTSADELEIVQDDIDDLRTQLSDLEASQPSGENP